MNEEITQCKTALHDETDLSKKIQNILELINQHTVRLSKIESYVCVAERRTSILLSLEEKVDDNMKRLNSMMLELKGIVAMVRPQVKKTGWYGQEIELKETIDPNLLN